jgi:hypothetical protein
LYLVKAKKSNDIGGVTLMKNMSFISNMVEKYIPATILKKIIFSLIVVIYFSFGFYHLADFISADEHFWLPNSGSERIEQYWSAIKNGKWENTRINDKPGITLAYTSGIALLFEKDLDSQVIKKTGTTRIYDTQKTKDINFAFRLPILLLSGLFSFFFFWIVKKITDNDWIALFTVAGIYLSPILIGMSQIVNPDSLFWLFGSASVLSFFAFLKEGDRKLAIWTGIFLGLSLASKYVSVIFFPFFFVMLLGHYLFSFEDFKGRADDFSKMVVRCSLWYVGILALGMLIFAILMPASFVEPKFFYEGTIGFPGMSKIFWLVMALNLFVIVDAWKFKAKATLYIFGKTQFLKEYLPKILYTILSLTVLFVLINWITRNHILDLSNIPFDAKRKDSFGDLPFYKKYIMEYVALVFSLTPITLIGLLFVWIKSIFLKSKHNFIIFMLSIFFLVFYAAVIMQGLLVTTRYSIILYPFVALLAAIAFDEFISIKNDILGKKVVIIFWFFIFSIAILQIFSLFQQSSFLIIKNKIDYYAPNYAITVGVLTALIGLVVYSIRKFYPYKKISKIPKILLLFIFLMANIGSIMLIKPFYFSYTNDLLPKNYIISGAWGYGGYEAAEYLNALPNAKNLTLWADVYGVCEFFVGKCIHKAKVDVAKNPIDYYFQSLQSTIGMNFPHPMENKPVWRMEIDDRGKSFLKIRKAKQLNAESLKNIDSFGDPIEE